MYTDSHSFSSPFLPEEPRFERSSLMGIDVERVTESQVIDHVAINSRRGTGGTIFSVNLDTLRQAHERADISDLLKSADLRIADGMPIIWAGAASGVPFPERVAGSSLVPSLSARAAKDGLSVYLLGGNEGVADSAALILMEDNPGLEVVGTNCPAFGFEKSEADIEEIRADVVAAAPDIVFVGLGFPKQEHLIQKLQAALPHAWFVSCGISFSFIAGEVRRAPQWMQRTGLEWFHRMVQEPRRLFRRYVIEDLPFLVLLMLSAGRARRMPIEQPH